MFRVYFSEIVNAFVLFHSGYRCDVATLVAVLVIRVSWKQVNSNIYTIYQSCRHSTDNKTIFRYSIRQVGILFIVSVAIHVPIFR